MALIDTSEMQQKLSDPTTVSFGFTYLPRRAGSMLFSARLEYTHFTPGTDANADFVVTVVNHDDLVFMIITIPISYREIAERLIDECGLRITNGVPHVITSNGVSAFPVSAENLLFLENKSGHPIYGADPDTTARIFHEEDVAVHAIFAAHGESPEMVEEEYKDEIGELTTLLDGAVGALKKGH